MLEVNVKDTRNNFSALLDRVEHGDEIVIKRHGKKVARLIAVGVEDRLPSLDAFRSSIKVAGKPMSEMVIESRK